MDYNEKQEMKDFLNFVAMCAIVCAVVVFFLAFVG